MYAGIDPSVRNTGVVVLHDTGELACSCNGKEAYRGKNFATDVARYICQADYIVRHLQQYDIRSIAYEDYSFNSVHRAFTLAEYGGILKARLHEALHVPLLLVSPSTNKKFATGYGYAEKHMVMRQAIAECADLYDASDDICDAYFLAKYALYKDNAALAVRLDKGNDNLRLRLEVVTHDTR